MHSATHSHAHAPYLREMPDAKKAVLMLHGICSTPRHFDWLLPAFDESWSVYNILLDGHGSDVSDFAHTSMKKWKDQVRHWLCRLSGQYETVLVVGFSLGALLAIEAAPDYPQVKGMILLNPPLRPWVRGRMILRAIRLTCGHYDPNDPHQVACSEDVSIRLTSNLLAYLPWAPRFAELLQLCRKCRTLEIAVPCHAYLGERDELVSLRSAAFLRENPLVTLRIFPTAGHFWFSPGDRETVIKDCARLLERLA